MTGSGTEDDPYIIYDVDDLQAVESDPTAYYELANNIDALATIGWNGGLGFAPLGDPTDGFTGSLDGKGYVVDGLFINRAVPGTRALAFIYFCDFGVSRVKNLGLTNVNITAITGNCAGFIGLAGYGVITNCYVTGSVTATYGWAGGFTYQKAGLIGVLEDCYSECTVVSVIGYAAGFADFNSGIIKRCYATGDVTAKANAAGFVRYNAGNGLIQDCYCRGNVTSTNNDDLGGFINHNMGADAVVDNCYSTGTLTTTGAKGGFCWLNWNVITNCFWDTESSGVAASDGGTGKTTAEMKTESTFTDDGWNFASVWEISPPINDGYPILVPRPAVTTQPVTGRGMIVASFNGLLNDDVGEPCECGFEWGADITYGARTPTETKVTGEAFSQRILGLFPGTEYHYRAFATNSAGTSYGDDESFRSEPAFSRAYALAREEL